MASWTRTAFLTALLAASALMPMTPAVAADSRTSVVQVAASEGTSRFVPLGIGKSIAIDLPADIKDVLVADPKIANAVIRTSRRVYIIGVTVGQTNIFFFDGEGRQIAGFDIAVTRDLNGLRGALRQSFPNSDIRVEGIGDGVMLSGSTSSPGEAQQAFDLASRLTNDGTKVVNGITVKGRDQVMLKVTVSEISRDVIKQLGIDLSGIGNYGSAVISGATSNAFSAVGQPLSTAKTLQASLSGITATLRAMERAGVIRSLAEPNLTAISGETATFIAGGEFPIPNGLSCDTTRSPPICQQQIDFKKFGVSLAFTPVVMAEGRISLKVMTEVSDLSTENSITLQVPGSEALTVPSIRTRRTETTVEIPSGGSLALAGMIQQRTKQQINGLPGLMQLPIIGTLFRSRDYINNQTELVVIVTPYLVRAVAEKHLSRPDDGFSDPSDPSTVFLGKLNRIYGGAEAVQPVARKTYSGNYGFILD